jgi:hypothetical protein
MDPKISRYGNMEIWKYGNVEIWKSGDLETWTLRGLNADHYIIQLNGIMQWNHAIQ